MNALPVGLRTIVATTMTATLFLLGFVPTGNADVSDELEDLQCLEPTVLVPETGVGAASASDGGDAMVLIPPRGKDLGFQPPCVTIENDRTAEIRHRDGPTGNVPHNPMNGDPAGGHNTGQCFSFRVEKGRNMNNNDNWALQFRVDNAGALQVSSNAGASWKTCPTGTADQEGTSYTIPYHCTIHPDTMQGKIVVETGDPLPSITPPSLPSVTPPSLSVSSP